MKLSRKEFLRSIIGIGVGVAGISALAACGGGGGDDGGDEPPVDGPPSNRNCQQNGASVAIGSNHGHTLMAVSKDDIAAGAMKTYNIQGSSAHPHSVTVTGAMFAMLQNNQTVTVTSSNDDSHTHTVTITCA